MRQSNIARSLAEFLIGLTWAHHDVSSDGLKLLQDILFSLPDISGDDWEDLHIYWNTPMSQVERQRLGQRLLETVTTQEDKDLVKAILTDIVEADGKIGSEEASLLRAASAALDGGDPQFVGLTERLLDHALPKRAKNMNAHTGRLEAHFQDEILSRLDEELGGDAQGSLGLEQDEVWKLIYTGTLMGRIAYADSDFDEAEMATMRRILERDWGLAPEYATIVIEFAVQAVESEMDLKRLTRHYFDLTTYQERQDFLDVMFDIARSHSGISLDEIGEIELISNALKMEPDDYEDAKARAFRKDAAPPLMP